MIEYIGKRKPETDEFKLHYRVLQNMMTKYNRIVIFAHPGSGKSLILSKLMEKYEGTKWNFYDGVSHNAIKIPFVYVSFHVEIIPDADIYYILQYSEDYKEAVTGIKFTDNFPRPIREYARAADWYKISQSDLRGKKFRTKADLKRAVEF